MSEFSWSKIESTLRQELSSALGALAGELAGDRVRAVVLHGVYAEEGGLISAPLLAVDTEGALAAPSRVHESGFHSARFNPADFRWPEVHTADPPLLALEGMLTAEACRGEPERWSATLARYEEVLVDVARALGALSPEILPVTDDFVAFVHDEAGGPELAARTIPAELFARHFPEQLELERQREAVAALPVEERVAFYLSRLGEYDGITTEEAQQALVAIGAAAAPALVDLLGEKARGWVAAKLLGHIGHPSPAIVEALRRAVAARGGSADWSAMALGALGDHEHLLDLADDPDLGRAAALGVTTRLLAWYPGHALDYAPLGRLLVRGGPPADRAIEQLKPGRALCTITAADVPVALAALASPHPVVRWHAASVLGNPKIGAKRAESVLEALVQTALTDEHPFVRRLSALSVARWKKRAAPYLPRLAPLRDDPDEVVRNVARSAAG